jgi:signal transduction histidine kinase
MICSAKFLISLVNDVLDFAALQSGKFRLTFENADIRACLKEVIDMIQVQLDFKTNVYLIESIPQNIPATFEMDSGRLKQLLINLLKNSIKFTFKGYIQLSVKMVKLLVVQDDKPYGFQDAICFEVFDTGIGIKQSKMNLLFKQFGKIEQEDQNINKEGTGIGLYIVKELATQLGGTITVRTKEKVYTQFALSLPMKQEFTKLGQDPLPVGFIGP